MQSDTRFRTSLAPTALLLWARPAYLISNVFGTTLVLPNHMCPTYPQIPLDVRTAEWPGNCHDRETTLFS
eukprot:13413114-Alexandrium_andersonii.AAC.1